jgi:hypothetical protein
VVPFGDFGVREDGVVRTCYASGESAGDVVVGGVDSFGVSGGVVLVLPVAVLG